MPKKRLADLTDLKGKRVLVRVDFNVPLEADGTVSNDRRVRAALPTIQYVLDHGGSVIGMSHLGRPKGDPKKDAPFRMDKVAARLQELLGRPVKKLDEVVGPSVTAAVASMKPGDVLVLENLRFHEGEQGSDVAFANQLAALGDVYVNDAFGTCHRSDASMVAVPAAMADKPRVVGFLVATELEVLDRLLATPPRPFIAILGGAKVSDKIGFIKSLLTRVDTVLLGGAMAYTFMKAVGLGVGNSKVEADKVDVAKELIGLAEGKLVMPLDHLVVEALDQPQTARVVEGQIPDGWMGVDIGPRTITRFQQEIDRARMVVWNGPLGKFEEERYSQGTHGVADAMAHSSAVTIVGGGETAEAVEEFGLADRMADVSTGGGAFLEYVEGTPFEALAQIQDRE
jgi:phosphoglycerate kinase